jgi:hypothetical protein
MEHEIITILTKKYDPVFNLIVPFIWRKTAIIKHSNIFITLNIYACYFLSLINLLTNGLESVAWMACPKPINKIGIPTNIW